MSFPMPELRGYSRPDFYHMPLLWTSLNGQWDFVFDDDDVGLQYSWHLHGLPKQHPGRRKIEVPFVFQAPASGLGEGGVHEVLWYERLISDPRDHRQKAYGERVLVRFGAVDYGATIWVDGQQVGSHRGGHVPFDVDATDAISTPGGPKRLTVRVFDSATDVTQPRGKQFWGPKPEGIYYTPSSGIWQCVWMEVVPATRIGDSSQGTILRSDDVEGGELHALVSLVGRRAGVKYFVEIEASFAGLVVISTDRAEMPETKSIPLNLNMRLSREHTQGLSEDILRASPLDNDRCWLNGAALWSPDHPLLYEIAIRLFDEGGQVLDEVKTTTGMRSISWNHKDGSLRLNGHPFFHALVLDQGYWPSSLMTPPNPSACRADIELAKAMGFNGCRKHQKVEDPLFMYWADRLGYLVWGEMASAFHFSPEYVDRFDQEWMEMVKRDVNHPCVMAWTLANESWGYGDLGHDTEQRDHLRSLYYRTKTFDPSRPINDNCGWEHVKTDLSSFHDYADAPGMADRCKSVHDIISKNPNTFLSPIGDLDEGSVHREGAPILCTEFGGVNIALGGKDTEHERGWGYTTAANPDDLLDRIDRLCMAVVEAGHVCGFVWTQLTDIEQETNGLYTYDRRIKLQPEKVKMVMEKAAQAYLSQHQTIPRSVGFRGGLMDSCRNLRLEGERVLVADCALDYSGKEWIQSRLDLNDCLTNSWGRLSWARGGNFKASSRNVRLVDGGAVLEAEAGDGKGWVHNGLRLEQKVRNDNGRLQMF